MGRTEHEEIKALTDAVNLFAQQMKLKLVECAKSGKRGWDGKQPSDISDYYIGSQMHRDAWFFTRIVSGAPDQERRNKMAIDIANRAMMLWFRHSVDANSKEPTYL